MSTPYRVRGRAASPLGRSVAAATAALLALTGVVALGAGPLAAPAAAAQLPQCPAPGEMPGIGNLPAFTDSNIAVYAGGNYSATGTAAESEGLLVVQGDATFDKAGGGVYNVGSAGVGSQITPPGGSTMLAVGGDLKIGPATSMDVGANVVGGGNVDVGGAVTNTVPIQLNGGTLTSGMGATAIAPYKDFGTVIAEQSTILASAAGSSGKLESWGELRFTGTPGDALHTFTIDGAALTNLGRKMSVFFDQVGDTAPIVVNVTGPAVDFDTQSFFFNGTQVGLASPEFGNAASRVLWNFVDATSVEIGENDQFFGSILASHADEVTIRTSTNGRVYVGGDLRIVGTGGIEQHNYPWIGPGPFVCLSPASGGFTVAKDVVGDGAALVPADTTFTVGYSYLESGTTVSGTLVVRADGTVAEGPQDLPAGTVVTLTESTLPDVPGVAWGTPSFAPSDTITIGETGKIAVTLTNTATTQVGGFSVGKALTGLAASQVPADTEFTVAYTVTNGGTSTQGTLVVRADGTVVDGPQNLPVGSVVTFTEIDLPTVAGVVWGAPVFSPASVTITDGVDALVTLTNRADAAVVPVGGFSLEKVVTGATAGLVPAGTEFTVAYTYDLGGIPVAGTLVVRADGAVVDGPQNLPVGTVVSFGEVSLPDVADVVWGTPAFSPATVTVAAGQNPTITLTNTAQAAPAGGFSVTKALTGEAVDKVPAATLFTVRYSYDLGGVPATGTLTVLADGTVVDGPQNLRAGTVVTFEEIDLPVVDGVVWGTPVFSPASITVGADQNAQVLLTNTATDTPAGGFSLAKEVTGTAAGLVPDATRFTVTYSYDLGGVPVTGTATVRADGTVVNGPQNLPVGTVVTFEEIDLPSIDGVVWGAPDFSPASVTIVDQQNAAVRLTNTADAVVVPTGGFSMAKAVTGPAAGTVPGDTEFAVAYEYTIDEVTTGGTLTLRADGTVVDGPQNLVAGTEVTFTELTPPSILGVAWGAATFSPASLTIGDGSSPTVTLTNVADLATGTFSVVKTVTGEAADLVPTGTLFTVEYAYEQDGTIHTGSLPVLADGTPVTFPGALVEGTVVSFSEIDLPSVDGVVWGVPVFSPGFVTIGAGRNVEIGLTNQANPVVVDPVGGFSLSKVVEGATAGLVPDGTQFTVAYSYDLDGVPTTGTATVLADGTVVDGPQDLPAGTIVTFEEIDLPSIGGVVWGTPVFTVDGEQVSSITVEADANVAVTLTNTATGDLAPTGPEEDEVAPTAPQDGGLAATGTAVAGITAAALLLLGAGAALVLGARRRRA